MRTVATDSKEFKRPKFARDPTSGTIERDPETSEVIVVDNRGFFTQLGVAVAFRDSGSYPQKFKEAFAGAAQDYRVQVPRLFGSSRFVLESMMLNNYPRTLSFLHNLVRRIESEVEHIFVNWLILPHNEYEEVPTGGTGSISTSFTPPEFIARMGNMWAAMAAWHYARAEGFPELDLRVDHFQGKNSPAWAELSSRYSSMHVVPWGDETDPFICTADIFAYLTDKTLRSLHLQLFPENVLTVWKGRSYGVRAAYLDASNINDISWTDQKPIRMEGLIPHPMTFLLIDSALMAEAGPVTDEMSFRGFLESKGYVNAAVLSAQLEGTGFKVLDPSEATMVGDGDRLVYMGSESLKRAMAIRDAVDVRIESMRELRERVRGKGFIC